MPSDETWGHALTHGRTDDRLASPCELRPGIQDYPGAVDSRLIRVATTLAKPIDNRTQFAGELM